MHIRKKHVFVFFLITGIALCAQSLLAQQGGPLYLPDAVEAGLKNYQSIQAKQNYLNASTAAVQNTKNEYLPNLIGSLQQSYGTVNSQFGPVGAVGLPGAGGGLAAGSSGPQSATQNWDAAFGALYILNTNWEFFSFGRVKSKVRLSTSQAEKDLADLTQEQFIHTIKVSSAYLNLLISQRLVQNSQANLDRTVSIQQSVRARTRSGLNAGVDSSTANAEVSRARLAYIESNNNEQQLRNQLAQLLNTPPIASVLDSSFLSRTPTQFDTNKDINQNPQVRFYQSRVDQGNSSVTYLKRSILPGLNFFGIYQGRASGFGYGYTPGSSDNYSKSYSDGVSPSRYNYLLGMSLSWNILSLAKISQQVNSQKFIAAAYQNEFDLITTQLKNQLILADQRIANSLQSVAEVPLQLNAARDAYNQKSVLYRNGLVNIVDLQLARFTLSRAETDMSVAYINVWQALLLKAAASGDIELFINQAR
ncbi:MAG TPA: TolC family protein [Cyclobacteriaceae bacterium]|nr:TolC family protein [Cyclobacteriaceae bacterium]